MTKSTFQFLYDYGMDIRSSNANCLINFTPNDNQPEISNDRINYWFQVVSHLNSDLISVYVDKTNVGDTVETEIQTYGDTILTQVKSELILFSDNLNAIRITKDGDDLVTEFGKLLNGIEV